jgi:hypothetical protein
LLYASEVEFTVGLAWRPNANEGDLSVADSFFDVEGGAEQTLCVRIFNDFLDSWLENGRFPRAHGLDFVLRDVNPQDFVAFS